MGRGRKKALFTGTAPPPPRQHEFSKPPQTGIFGPWYVAFWAGNGEKGVLWNTSHGSHSGTLKHSPDTRIPDSGRRGGGPSRKKRWPVLVGGHRPCGGKPKSGWKPSFSKKRGFTGKPGGGSLTNGMSQGLPSGAGPTAMVVLGWETGPFVCFPAIDSFLRGGTFCSG